jgi:probable HAF family extracellular repeat protein
MRSSTVAVLAVLTSFFGSGMAFAQMGALIDLGAGTRAYGINAAGQITGCMSIATGGQHAYLYSDGTLTDLGTLGGTDSCGYAINAGGQVTGSADTTAGSSAFLYGNGTMTDLTGVGGMPTLVGNDINDNGDVVGSAPQFGVGGTTIAFLYSHGAVIYLFPTSSDYTGSTALAINDDGLIAGDIVNWCGMLCPFYQPFSQLNGTTTYLPLPPGPDGGVFDAQISGINSAGQIITTGEDPDGFWHGSVYTNGVPADLGANTTANGINSSGDIVGNSGVPRSGIPNDPRVGVFLYSGGVDTDLALPGLNPTGLNDNGWAIDNHAVLDHAYLFLPTSNISLAPSGLPFGNEPISVPSSPALPVTLTNATSVAISVGTIAVTAPFSATGHCPVSLAAGASCTIDVSFTPTDLETHADALTVTAGNTTYATLLQGAGVIMMTLTPAGTNPIVGNAFTISWQSGTDATSCTGSGGSWPSINGSLPAKGSQAITEAAAGTYTYSLSCLYGSSPVSVAAAKLVVVVAQEAPPPTSGGGGGGGSTDAWLLYALASVWVQSQLSIRARRRQQ